jgi:L-cysteine:1D-myo-inositol 2-amino-2-deoxy-alpha-D-glucopyranoside ligase
MVALDGEKMSKSKGNLEFVSRLRRAGKDPRAIRLALMGEHYRSDWEWTPDRMTTADERLSRWSLALGRPAGPSADAFLTRMRERLADDLDAPGALAVVDEWCATGGDDPAGPPTIRRAVDALLGIALTD